MTTKTAIMKDGRRYTLRVNGEMMTDIRLTVSLTEADLKQYNAIAKEMGYKDYRHYLDGILSNAVSFSERYDEYKEAAQ